MIREGTVQDIAEIATLCVQMHLESNYRDTPLSMSKVVEFLTMAVHAKDAKVTVAECSSMVFGVHIGFVTPAWFSDSLVGYDALLYISPDKRGGMTSARLIKSFETWAFSNGATEIRPGTSTGVMLDSTRELHERLGYTTVGHNFRKVK